METHSSLCEKHMYSYATALIYQHYSKDVEKMLKG